jgi:hypothetical protein
MAKADVKAERDILEQTENKQVAVTKDLHGLSDIPIIIISIHILSGENAKIILTKS